VHARMIVSVSKNSCSRILRLFSVRFVTFVAKQYIPQQKCLWLSEGTDRNLSARNKAGSTFTPIHWPWEP